MAHSSRSYTYTLSSLNPHSPKKSLTTYFKLIFPSRNHTNNLSSSCSSSFSQLFPSRKIINLFQSGSNTAGLLICSVTSLFDSYTHFIVHLNVECVPCVCNCLICSLDYPSNTRKLTLFHPPVVTQISFPLFFVALFQYKIVLNNWTRFYGSLFLFRLLQMSSRTK